MLVRPREKSKQRGGGDETKVEKKKSGRFFLFESCLEKITDKTHTAMFVHAANWAKSGHARPFVRDGLWKSWGTCDSTRLWSS
jgi:hypothetical protein